MDVLTKIARTDQYLSGAEGQVLPNRAKQLSITEKLIKKLSTPLVSECQKCQSLGLLYTYQNKFPKQSGFALCSCISHLCQEERCYAPYERYDAPKQSIFPCECRPARLSLERIQYLEKRSQIPYKYRGHFLDHISMTRLPKESNLGIALDCAEEIVCDFLRKDSLPAGLYLHGNTGCGKTLLSCALLNEMLRFHKVAVRYAKISRDILSKIRASFNPNSDFYGEGAKIEEELGRVTVLVIDDFDIYKETDWVQSVLYDLIDARYENNLLTVINSNKPMSFWKDTAGGRIYSRLREMCTEIAIVAPDYRTEVHGKAAYY